MRCTRSWFLNEHKDIYKARRIEWNVNVGLPTDSYHNENLLSVYRRIVIAAWRVSVCDKPITLKLAGSAYRDDLAGELNGEIQTDNDLHPDLIGLFPEFAAQVTGYVKSSLRRPGLHALIDVGAGTVDFTVFNVHEHDGDEKFPIFARDVKPLGAQYLVKNRLKQFSYSGSWKPAPHDLPLTSNEFADRVGVQQSDLNFVDKAFVAKVSSQIIESLRYTKTVRYSTSSHWKDGIPMFVCGGGAKVDVYDDFFSRLGVNRNVFPINKMTLPKPSNLIADRLDVESFDRLSVAYGLAMNALDMVEVTRQNEVEDERLGWNDGNGDHPTCPQCGGWGGGYGNCTRCGGRGFL